MRAKTHCTTCDGKEMYGPDIREFQGIDSNKVLSPDKNGYVLLPDDTIDPIVNYNIVTDEFDYTKHYILKVSDDENPVENFV